MVFLIIFRWTAGALHWYIWKILFQNAIDPLSDRIGCYLKCMSQHFSWFNSFPAWICAWHNEVFSIRVDLFWGKKIVVCVVLEWMTLSTERAQTCTVTLVFVSDYIDILFSQRLFVDWIIVFCVQMYWSHFFKNLFIKRPIHSSNSKYTSLNYVL